MTLRLYVVLVALVAFAGGGLLLGETALSSPGEITEDHAALELECRACHEPFQGASTGCVACHGEMAPQNAHRDAGIECADCHREHRGATVSLNGAARLQCSGCHEHGAIGAVAAHAVGAHMTRPAELASPRRAEGRSFESFSHAGHFEDTELDGDASCDTCHRAREAGAEPGIAWGACEDCHDTGSDAAIEDLDLPRTDRQRFERLLRDQWLTVSLDRFERVAFLHTEEHLETDCEACHVEVRRAVSLRNTGEGLPSVASIDSCFGCHVHRPEDASWPQSFPGGGPDSDYASGSEVECAGCHEFHGTGAEAEIAAADSKEEPRPSGWDFWGRPAALSITPWLLLFVGLSGAGFAWTWRRLPEASRAPFTANPDVAPQPVAEAPVLSGSGESSVPGLYLIGELAGIPLVNRAMKSGFDVVDAIASRVSAIHEPRSGEGGEEPAPEDRVLDLLIAGSGPAGLGAGTRAESLGLSYVVCEKSTAAATIRDYPRAKIIQAAPVEIPDYGTFFQEEDESKEAMVRRWEDIITRTGLVMREREEVVDIRAHGEGGFEVEVTGDKVYRAMHVVLAIGMRGSPRRLRIPGETADRVSYSLIDAGEHREQELVVVGGGNAAVEAALALSAPELLNRVRLVIRGPVLKGITPQNSKNIDEAAAQGQLEIVASSTPSEILERSVRVDTPEGPVELPADRVFALIGAEIPIPFLKKIGVRLARKGF